MHLRQASALTSSSVSRVRILEGYLIDIIAVSIVLEHHGIKILYDEVTRQCQFSGEPTSWMVGLTRGDRMPCRGRLASCCCDLWHRLVQCCLEGMHHR